jgi:hypothetical protein
MTKKEKEKKEVADFDWETAISEYDCADMLKVGMITYFTDNNIKITSDKDFEKAVNNYLNLNVGE